MKILIIDSNVVTNIGSENIVRFVRGLGGHTSYVRRGPEGDLPSDPKQFQKVILSGSLTSAMDEKPWVKNLEAFVRKTVEAGIPLLGICYGHQVVAKALGGSSLVGKGPEPEFGWTKVEVDHKSLIFEGLPKTFYSFSSHYDEVKSVPPGCRLIAHSERCGIQAYEAVDKPLWTVQFHPEKTLEEATHGYKKEKKQGFFLHPGKEKTYFNAKVGETIFGNFLRGSPS